MVLAAYLMLPSSHLTGLWRHPYSDVDMLDQGFYQSIARTLERGGFDVAFLPDTLSLPTDPEGSHDDAVRYGTAGAIRPDPAHVVNTMAAVTTRLSFVVTASTTFTQPYHLARQFSTLNHLTGGRVGWNIITSALDGDARNFGLDAIPSHEDRYARAHETLEAVTALWDSWEDGAVIADRRTGVFADPSRVRPVDYRGRHVTVRGALTLPRQPGGRPALFQAGESDTGREFAARWADGVFVIQNDLEAIRAHRDAIGRRAAAHGRPTPRVLAAVQVVVGETREIARQRAAFLSRLVDPAAAIAAQSVHWGVDLRAHDPSTRVTRLLADHPHATPGPRIERLLAERPGHDWTIEEIAVRYAESASTPRVTGTPADVADELEALFRSGVVDGFVITPTAIPGTFEEIAHAVVPELRRRGLLAGEASRPPGLGALVGAA